MLYMYIDFLTDQMSGCWSLFNFCHCVLFSLQESENSVSYGVGDMLYQAGT